MSQLISTSNRDIHATRSVSPGEKFVVRKAKQSSELELNKSILGRHNTITSLQKYEGDIHKDYFCNDKNHNDISFLKPIAAQRMILRNQRMRQSAAESYHSKSPSHQPQVNEAAPDPRAPNPSAPNRTIKMLVPGDVKRQYMRNTQGAHMLWSQETLNKMPPHNVLLQKKEKTKEQKIKEAQDSDDQESSSKQSSEHSFDEKRYEYINRSVCGSPQFFKDVQLEHMLTKDKLLEQQKSRKELEKNENRFKIIELKPIVTSSKKQRELNQMAKQFGFDSSKKQNRNASKDFEKMKELMAKVKPLKDDKLNSMISEISQRIRPQAKMQQSQPGLQSGHMNFVDSNSPQNCYGQGGNGHDTQTSSLKLNTYESGGFKGIKLNSVAQQQYSRSVSFDTIDVFARNNAVALKRERERLEEEQAERHRDKYGHYDTSKVVNPVNQSLGANTLDRQTEYIHMRNKIRQHISQRIQKIGKVDRNFIQDENLQRSVMDQQYAHREKVLRDSLPKYQGLSSRTSAYFHTLRSQSVDNASGSPRSKSNMAARVSYGLVGGNAKPKQPRFIDKVECEFERSGTPYEVEENQRRSPTRTIKKIAATREYHFKKIKKGTTDAYTEEERAENKIGNTIYHQPHIDQLYVKGEDQFKREVAAAKKIPESQRVIYRQEYENPLAKGIMEKRFNPALLKGLQKKNTKLQNL